MHSQKVTNLDIIGHFWKSTKTPFFPKLITWAWNIKIIWDQKGWLEDISRFLKSQRTPPKVQYWRSYALLKLDIFPNLPKVNYPQNSNFWQKGPLFPLDMVLSCHTRVPSLISWPNIYFLFYLIFIDLIHFKSILNQIKSKNWWNRIFVIGTTFNLHDSSNQFVSRLILA